MSDSIIHRIHMSSSQLLPDDDTIGLLPTYKTFSPIPGYSGHIPGERWRIGSHESQSSPQPPSIRSDSFIRPSPPPIQLLNGSSLNQGINMLSNVSNGQDLQNSWDNNSSGGAHQLAIQAAPHEYNNIIDHKSNNFDTHNPQTFVGQTSPDDQQPIRSTTNFVANNTNVNSDQRAHQSRAVDEYDQPNSAGQQQRLVPPPVAVNQHQSAIQYPLDGSRQRRLRSVSAEQRPQQNNDSIRRQQQSRKAHLVDDVFAGMKSGWWSQGEVMRNRQRREMVNRGLSPNSTDMAPLGAAPSAARNSAARNFAYFDNNSDGGGGDGGGGSTSAASTYDDQKSSMELEQKRIPIAGYSGHLPGMRGNDCGKSFDVAARDSLEYYWAQRLQQLQQHPPQ